MLAARALKGQGRKERGKYMVKDTQDYSHA